MKAHSPRWADEAHTKIDLIFAHPTAGEIPFTAVSDDCEQLSSDLYAKAIAGDFGEIAPYEPPTVSLMDLKESIVTAINSIRDKKESDGFVYLGKHWDSDERAIKRITVVAQAAQQAIAAGAPFEIEWTFADNSSRTLSAHEICGAPIAMALQADALHRHARNLKTAVQNASSNEEVEAIDIQTGWPTVGA